jgi:hypothetical protein
LTEIDGELSRLPDDAGAVSLTRQSEDTMRKLAGAQTLLLEAVTLDAKVMGIQDELKRMPDQEKAAFLLKRAEDRLARSGQVAAALAESQEVAGLADKAERVVTEAVGDEKKAREEHNEALAGVDVCPVTTRPISGECLKEARMEPKG